MPTPGFSLDPDTWFEEFVACSTTETQYDFLLQTLRQPLTDEQIEDLDLAGGILDVIPKVIESEKRFEVGIDFLNQFRQLQPDLYKREVIYYVDYFFWEAAYYHRPENLDSAIRLIQENPDEDIDQFLPFHRNLWYWCMRDQAVDMSRAAYQSINDRQDKYIGHPEDQLEGDTLYNALQTDYERWTSSVDLDVSAARLAAQSLGLEISDERWQIVLNAMGNAWDREVDPLIFTENRRDFLLLLEIRFLVYLYLKGMPFATSHLIWRDLVKFWQKDNKDAQTPEAYFQMTQFGFDRHLGDKFMLFSPLIFDIGASLWGAEYGYDFLAKHNLILPETAGKARQVIRNLKWNAFDVFHQRLWMAAFVTGVWPKPDSVSTEVFEAEGAIIERTYPNTLDFEIFKTKNKVFFDALPPYVDLKEVQPVKKAAPPVRSPNMPRNTNMTPPKKKKKKRKKR
jgi:hypothetical protein